MANLPDVKGDSLPDLDDLLQCPVCYEIPAGQIFQCNEGHHVCGRCKARLDQCPVCRALFFGTRNYAMEELIANVRKLQAFKLGGKMTVTSGSIGSESTTSADTSIVGANQNSTLDAEDQDQDDSSTTSARAPPACKGLFRCLCCKNGNSERLPSGRLLNHLRYFHAPDLIEGKSEGGEYVQAWQIATVPGRIVIAVRVSDMGVFFLVIEINKDAVYSWVTMAAAPWVAHEFCYTITISGNDREAIYSDCVSSVRSCEGALKRQGRCLVANGTDVRALTATANVSGRLAIRRIPPDQLANQTQPRAVLRVASRGTAEPTPPVVARPQPRSNPRDLEPFLQDLQNGVERLSQAFASLGRQANALVHPEPSSLRPNAERRTVSTATETQQPTLAPVQEAATSAQQTDNNDLSHLSRNARRRMRQRLRVALNASAVAITSTAPQTENVTAGFALQSQQTGTRPIDDLSLSGPSNSRATEGPSDRPSQAGAQARNKKKRRNRRR